MDSHRFYLSKGQLWEREESKTKLQDPIFMEKQEKHEGQLIGIANTEYDSKMCLPHNLHLVQTTLWLQYFYLQTVPVLHFEVWPGSNHVPQHATQTTNYSPEN